MVRVVARLCENNKRVGFLVNTGNNVIPMRDAEIQALIDSGRLDIDIVYRNGRVYYNHQGRKISDLPEKKYSDAERQRDFTGKGYFADETIQDLSETGIEVYMGYQAKSLVYRSNALRHKERNCVDEIVRYCRNNKLRNVLGLVGLRGTGKTTAMLQAMVGLGEWERICYVYIPDSTNIGVSTLINLLGIVEAKYIFVDGITNLENFVTGSSRLCDEITLGLRKKVVITGDLSYLMYLASMRSLANRMSLIGTTFITFSEYLRMQRGASLQGYLNSHSFVTFDKVVEYVDSRIVQDIYKSILIGEPDFHNVTMLMVRQSVYRVLVESVYSVFRKTSYLGMEGNSLSDFVLQQVQIMLYSNGIDFRYCNGEVLSRVELALQKMGVVYRVENAYYGDYRYYITDIGIAMTICRSIMYSINYTDLGSAEYKMGDAYRFAFECALMCHCYYSTVVRGRGCTWYYLNRDNCVTVDVIERDRDRQYHLFNVTTQSSIGAGRAVAGAFSNSRDILDEALNVYQVGQNGVITIADGGLLMVRG